MSGEICLVPGSTLFVFGAGASYASQLTPVSDEDRAPLTDRLFDQTYRSRGGALLDWDWEECQKGIQDAGSLESFLTARWDAASKYSVETTKRAEQLFFGRVTLYLSSLLQRVSQTYIGRDNAYFHLLRRLKEQDKAFGLISFNYDTLLDQAVQDVFSNLRRLDDYTSIRYFKPHGSVNWFFRCRPIEAVPVSDTSFHAESQQRRAVDGFFTGPPLRLDECVIFDPRHLVLNDIASLYRAFNNEFCYPFILVPLTTKLYARFVGLQEHIVRPAQDCAADANEVYLVGYRAADEVVYDIFSTVRDGTVLHVVDLGSNAAEIRQRVLTKQPRFRAGRLLTDGFASFAATY